MPIPRPTQKQVLDRIFNRLRAETPLTANLDSSIVGVICKIIAAEVDEWWAALEEYDRQADVFTATGANLDNIGMTFGVPRRQARSASSVGFTRAVRFTNLGVGSVTIPAGIRVYRSVDPQVAFFTSEGVTLGAGQSSEVHVNAAETGEYYNVSIGQLDSHSYPGVSVKVTNILPIQNGASVESDDSYRERIVQDMRRRDVLNVDNTDALLRRVPGVRDVFILDKYRGAGTFDAIVIPYNQSAVAEVVAECNRLLTQFVPIGISAIAKPPRYRQLDVRINLRFTPDTGDRKDLIRESIKAQISSRIDSLPVEDGTGLGTFNVKQINATALQSDNAVLDAVTVLGLDGAPLSNEGEIRLNIGERLVLRSLVVE